MWIFELLELLLLFVDLFTWIESKPNRRARRAARRTGAPLPPKTNWTRAFIIITIAVVTGAALLIVHWLA